MRKTLLTIAALTLFVGMAPALAQEGPSPTPSTERPAAGSLQQPAAKSDATRTDATKKAEPAARPRRIRHYRYGWYWPWDWAWYHWRYAFRHHHY
jgi:hypothetical protein